MHQSIVQLQLLILVVLLLIAVDHALIFTGKNIKTTTPTTPTVVLDLLNRCAQVQSPASRREVELLIEKLSSSRKKLPISPGSWRTVWSTVTSDNPVGWALRQKPNVILGGQSWQLLSKSRTKSENVVYWPSLGLRMAGLADLSPLDEKNKVGYKLRISGLEFRWGLGEADLPEKRGLLRDDQKKNVDKRSKSWTAVALAADVSLSNGVGTLEVLYNDGVVRCVRDSIQKNVYIHIKEPVPAALMSYLL